MEITDFLADDAAGDVRALADHHADSMNVAMNLAIDLQFTLRYEVALDRQVGSDDGRSVAFAAPTRPLQGPTMKMKP